MFQWMVANSGFISAIVNLGMLLVWGIYLDLILRSHRRARRCKILISFAGQDGLNARCLISNMSAEPVYVVKVMATVTTGRESWSSSVTEYGAIGEETPLNPERMTRQGPLLTGHWRDIGSLLDLLERARDLRGDSAPIDELEQDHMPTRVDLTVIALYGSEDLPAGAHRPFTLARDDGGWSVAPASPTTSQVRGRRARRALYELF